MRAASNSIMFAALLASALVPPPQPAAVHLPACTAQQVTLATDSLNGDFNGMSHSGTLLIVRNYSGQPCTVLPLPTLTFLDKAGRPLAIERQVPPGLHPGPVQVPVVAAARAELTARIRWVSGAVFDGPKGGTCLNPAWLALPLAGGTVRTPLRATLCGPTGKPVTYEFEPLHPDPVYKP